MLNTIIEDKTILWWGGLGRSTEHTAYLRLKAGHRAPESGSCALNGPMLSTQIGAQIFTDPLALMSPGDPEQAALLIRKAASVSHDGMALDCAAYLGALQALAFEHRSLDALLDAAEPFASGDQLRRLLDDVRGICAPPGRLAPGTGVAGSPLRLRRLRRAVPDPDQPRRDGAWPRCCSAATTSAAP